MFVGANMPNIVNSLTVACKAFAQTNKNAHIHFGSIQADSKFAIHLNHLHQFNTAGPLREIGSTRER